MSGGHFDYNQYRIEYIKDSIIQLIKNNNIKDQYDYVTNYSEKTLLEFKNAIYFLTMAQIYAQRVDWLVSGDDSEESFHERLKDDVEEAIEQTLKKYHGEQQ